MAQYYCVQCNKYSEYKEVKSDNAVLWENSHAVLQRNSYAVLWENSHAVLQGNSHAVLRENSRAVLWGNSHAVLWENSHAVLWENSHAVLWGNSHAQTQSPYALSIVKSKDAIAVGNKIGDKLFTATEWLTNVGIVIKNGKAILYKKVGNNGETQNNVVYPLNGGWVESPDWDDKFDGECGKGLHACPTPAQTDMFRDNGVYIAIEIAVEDIANLPAFAQYPDKIRFKGGNVLYVCDREGNPIKES